MTEFVWSQPLDEDDVWSILWALGRAIDVDAGAEKAHLKTKKETCKR